MPKRPTKRGRRDVPVRLPRAHRVVARAKTGAVRIYWYRRRGEAPAMKVFTGATLAEALQAEADGADELIAAYEAGRRLPNPNTVRDLVTRFKAAPDGFLKLREGTTRKAWAPWLDRIIDEFGDMPVLALKAKGAKRDVIEWRNRWSKQPRTADYAIQVLRRLYSWAMENELADANPAEGIKGLYAVNRADVIVEEDELAKILAAIPTEAGRLAIRLAAATGLRRGDLIDLRWSEVSEFSIERAASKSTTGRRLLVPLTTEARTVIAELRRLNKARKVPSAFVLTSRKGPWNKDGLGSTWWKAAKAAGVDKHLHDLRGTACTRFCSVPLEDEEVADIMGWEPDQVRAIRKRYVDRARIAEAIVARMERSDR